MEPIRFFYPLSNWLLRLAVLILVYWIFFIDFRVFNYKSVDFWVACGFGLFAILLFMGGFMKKHNLTIISALILVLGCVYEIIMHFAFGSPKSAAIFAVFGAIALYFAAAGNKKK